MPRQPRVEAAVPANGTGRAADGIREIRRLFQTAQRPPRWPMYIRQLKQYLRGRRRDFDERKYGFETLGDLMRACQRDGLLRIERDRQGGMRIFPGTLTPPAGDAAPMQDDEADGAGNIGKSPNRRVVRSRVGSAGGIASEPEVVEGDVLQESDVPQVIDAEEAPAARREAVAPSSAWGEGRPACWRGARAAEVSRRAGPGEPRTENAQASRQTAFRPQPPRTDAPTSST